MFRNGLASAAPLLLGAILSFHSANAADAPAAAPVATQAFSNWAYRCQNSPDGKPACEVVQEMVVQQDGKSVPVLTMAFARPDAAQKAHLVTILAPLGVQLKPGLAIAADEGKPINFDFQYCDQRGCWIAGQKGDALLTLLKQGKTGAAKVTLVNGRNLTINFSLAGLGAGAAALDNGKPPVQAAQTSAVSPGASPAEKPKTN